MPALGKQLQVLATEFPSVLDVYKIGYEQKDFNLVSSAVAETGWLPQVYGEGTLINLIIKLY